MSMEEFKIVNNEYARAAADCRDAVGKAGLCWHLELPVKLESEETIN